MGHGMSILLSGDLGKLACTQGSCHVYGSFPTEGINCNVGCATHTPSWFCFETEDPRESLSLLSEESCSSSAGAKQSIIHHQTPWQGRTQEGLTVVPCPVGKYGEKKIYAKERHCKERDKLHQVEGINGPEKFKRMSYPSSSKPTPYSTPTFYRGLGLEDSWLFDQGYTSVDRNSGFSSSCQTPGTKKHAVSGCKHWTEDPFGAYSDPELHVDTKSSVERSKPGDPAEWLPYSFVPEKPFCQPFGQVHPSETPFFSNIRPGPNKFNLCPDSNKKCTAQDSFHIPSYLGRIMFNNITVQEIVSKGGDELSEMQPTDWRKFELQEDICKGSNGFSSEGTKPEGATDSKDNCSACNEPNDRTREMEGLKVTCSPEHAEETSSSVKIPDKSDGSTDEKEHV